MTGAESRNSDRREVVEEERIPLVEERVHTRKVVREGNSVTVRIEPTERVETVREPVRRETLRVERRPVGTVVDSVPETRTEGDTTIIPVTEQRARVVIETVLVEEIHVHRDVTEEVVEEEVALRGTSVDIERD